MQNIFPWSPPRFATWLTTQFGLACPPLLTGCYAITQSTVNSYSLSPVSTQHTEYSQPLHTQSRSCSRRQEPPLSGLASLCSQQNCFFPNLSSSHQKPSDFSVSSSYFSDYSVIFSFSPTLTTKTASLSPTLPQSNPGYLRKKEPNIISIAKLIRPVQLITIWPCYKFIHELFCPSQNRSESNPQPTRAYITSVGYLLTVFNSVSK